MNPFSEHRLPITVLLPIYHGDKALWLRESLKSIEAQTAKASEIIIVQDGPISGELEEELHRWQKHLPEIKIVKLPENRGIPAALNAGVQAASQPWIARMDADDIAEPYRFEIQWQFLQRHPEVAIIGSWIDEYDEGMKYKLASRELPTSHADIFRFAHWRCPFNHQTVLYRRDAVLSVGGYPLEKVMGEDYVLWTRLLHAGYLAANIPKALVRVRAGTSLIYRRRGRKYLKLEYKSMYMIYQMGFYKWYHYVIQLLIRTTVRLMPVSLVESVYKLLRKN
ncbi:putative glycosyltransferase [Thermaurantimonas aggregans]|uniref:Putative glycosyltransferase n=1 Tax=Thermaurantimonas aggregans TaxID=2173829 RepID=A0A401XJ67_9FLAO|nr:glycosyltransferase [Thermaurantimonas aggregans]MCX8149680.1 glycosyltransferase [Thermaurantimonas aggregans]GCD77077.1 putative glycosyltransferase [Thermaurantimonas aggregans]